MFNPNELHIKFSRVDAGYYTLDMCGEIASKLGRILELKKQCKAVVLAHNYQRPEIFEIADYTGDSLGLSLQAAEVKDADVIVFCGVHFMAETAKVVNPYKKVILPNQQAGCSLADMVDEINLSKKIEELRTQYDDLAIVCYVNTTAAVKALSDSCCTSANAVEVVAAIPNKNILLDYTNQLLNQISENPYLMQSFKYIHKFIEDNNLYSDSVINSKNIQKPIPYDISKDNIDLKVTPNAIEITAKQETTEEEKQKN